jgi:hypothetical protein
MRRGAQGQTDQGKNLFEVLWFSSSHRAANQGFIERFTALVYRKRHPQ